MLNRRNRKGLFFLSVVLILCGNLVGCSGMNEDSKEVSISAVEERIKQAVSLEEMQKGDMNRLKKLYQIDEKEVEDFVLYTATSNVKANELAVIKVKQADQAESVQEKIRERIEAQKLKLKDYRPKEFYLVERHVLKANQSYILFVVSEDADTIEAVFDEALS